MVTFIRGHIWVVVIKLITEKKIIETQQGLTDAALKSILYRQNDILMWCSYFPGLHYMQASQQADVQHANMGFTKFNLPAA